MEDERDGTCRTHDMKNAHKLLVGKPQGRGATSREPEAQKGGLY